MAAKAAACVGAKARRCGGRMVYESWKIVPLAAPLLHAVLAGDRQADRVARNATRTFMCG